VVKLPYKTLFIFIEGNDDERFFKQIIEPLIQNKYSIIRLWKYSKVKLEKRINFIKSITSMKADYIYVTDVDTVPCITFKKEQIKKELSKMITEDKIVIVVREIESWYLAGLEENNYKKIGIRKRIETTDNLTKGSFNQCIPKRVPRSVFMQEILEYYDIEVAKRKNKSFDYFLNNWIKSENTVQ
jgi:hypothetical protein